MAARAAAKKLARSVTRTTAYSSSSPHLSIRSLSSISTAVRPVAAATSPSIGNADKAFSIPAAIGVLPAGIFRYGIRSFTPSRFYHSNSQVDESEFTEMALAGFASAVEAANQSKQQVVESEHLMKALLEQKDGLARRIFTKAGVDNTTALQTVDQFIARQPKVTGGISRPIMGSSFGSLLDNARKCKKEFGDDYLSVEHLILALFKDKRFGERFFGDLQLEEKEVRDAVMAIRGNRKVTDPNPESKYQALERYGNDLTELAKRGKLDPVIGRDDEIRRCIQILSRRTKNNPVIIGEPGVGKTAIAEGTPLMS